MHGSGIKECSHRVWAEGPKTAADEGEDGNAEPVDAAGGEGENENSDEGGKAAAHYSDTQGTQTSGDDCPREDKDDLEAEEPGKGVWQKGLPRLYWSGALTLKKSAGGKKRSMRNAQLFNGQFKKNFRNNLVFQGDIHHAPRWWQHIRTQENFASCFPC